MSQTSFRRCPYCGSARLARIIWGYPAFELLKERKEDYVFAGCGVPSNPPEWACRDCGISFKFQLKSLGQGARARDAAESDPPDHLA